MNMALSSKVGATYPLEGPQESLPFRTGHEKLARIVVFDVVAVLQVRTLRSSKALPIAAAMSDVFQTEAGRSNRERVAWGPEPKPATLKSKQSAHGTGVFLARRNELIPICLLWDNVISFAPATH